MNMKVKVVMLSVAFFTTLFLNCSSSTVASDDGKLKNDNSSLPNGFAKYGSNVEVYLDGDFVVVKANGVPTHKSPYFETSNALYEPYNGTNPNYRINPNRIVSKEVTYRIPLNPTKATNSQATPLGAMGVSINGVPFYNQYAGPNNQPLTNEINSFDQYGGHPQGQGQYHYHLEPFFLTEEKGKDALMGYLLDGFPVYGSLENGKTVQNSNLDQFHGHSHATTEYPNGIYHYHITDADPYINGSGFYGIAGTVSR